MLRIIIFAPLLGAAVNWLVGQRLKDKPYAESFSGLVACAAILVSMVVAFYLAFAGANPALFSAKPVLDQLWTWIEVGSFRADFGLAMDHLSGIYACFITFVGLLIHIFATGYMHGDKGYYRFFAYLNLFMFSMLTLILADNMLLMFVGWEGVGLCSYLLIGFYTKREEARVAAKKAFVANRVGDWGVILGIMLTFVVTSHMGAPSISFFDKVVGGVEIKSALATIASLSPEPFTLGALFAGGISSIALLLFIGATGKSAQIPLFVWLPDAMAGPTPVSALIHAATMVTAGVYMVVRCNAIYQLSPTVMFIVAIIGAATAIFAATIGLAQNDIKKVLAYSTISQLGYMFLACGVGGFVAAIFHVMTHAFFKALLFLGSGSVIHGMHHEQDMRRMGNLRKYLPVTCATMVTGWLAICGVPVFSGFFSKDEILWKTFSTPLYPNAGKALWVVGALTALLTAIYMTRLMVMTFWGSERFDVAGATGGQHGADDVHAYAEVSHTNQHAAHASDDDADEDEHAHHGPIHPHETDWRMKGPLIVLAVFAVLIGFVGVPHALSGGAIPNYFEQILEPVIAHVGTGGANAGEVHDAHLPRLLMPAPQETDGEPAIIMAAAEPSSTSSVGAPESSGAGHEVRAPGESSASLERTFTGISVAIALLGIGIGVLMFRHTPLRAMPSILENKYYVDEIYDAMIIEPINSFAREGLWKVIDIGVVDGAVNDFARGLSEIGQVVRKLQFGLVRSYAAVILIGALVVIGFFAYVAVSVGAHLVR